jgi:hypothetical protein
MEWCPKVEVSKANGKLLNRIDDWRKNGEFVVEKWETLCAERLEIVSSVLTFNDKVDAWSALCELMEVWEREDNWAKDVEDESNPIRKRSREGTPG